MGNLKSFDEMRKIDVSPYVDQRDGMDYLNWAKCIDLLHEHGAKEVWFEQVVDPKTNSSIFMTDVTFVDKNGNINRNYEVEVKVHIDDLEFNFRHPLTNGSNPVKDNSLTQSRVWAAQTRAFVKGVAIHTGLGFGLWLKNEESEIKKAMEVDAVALQDPDLYFTKLGQMVAQKIKETGKNEDEIGHILGVEEKLGTIIKQKCNELKQYEKALEGIKK